MAEPVQVQIIDEDDSTRFNPETDSIETDTPAGGVVVQFNAGLNNNDDGNSFYANLADKIDAIKLQQIANELCDAIEADDRSRAQALQIRARGLDLLGIKLEEPRSTVGDSASGVDGMSSVTNPLLLEACLKGWANARAELLPAEGPCKVSVDDDETLMEDELAESLERDFNHYLTEVATEYYPDTSHMLLWGTYFGGSGFKKIYRCPMRRRPVSESVPMEDLIVSDTTKDFRSCARITHQIQMRSSVMRRMKKLGAYRDVALTVPTPQPNVVDNKIANIQGVNPQFERPEDQPYTIWETQCELDLPDYAPTKFKREGIPLPYLVTLDKDSRTILALRRDWREDDEECERKRMYVKYPYVPGPGFYGTGMLGILGNCTAAMTTAWREALDAGMFASFPGGLIAKMAGRQNSSNLRAGPGEFIPVETANNPIQQAVMPFPYKDPSPGLLGMIDKITAQAKELAGSAEAPAQEGLANVPVGTMLAQIEQITKVMAAAHKDMHQAQAEEFHLITDIFRDYPEDFWRRNKVAPSNYWNEQKLLQALEDYQLEPRSDPNTPSHIHRMMKAIALVQLIQMPMFTPIMDAKEVLQRCLRVLREDPQGIIVEAPAAGGPDPVQMIAAQAKAVSAQAQQAKVQVEAQKVQAQAATDKDDAAIKAAQLAAEQQIENTRLQREEVIHRNDALKGQQQMVLDNRKQRLAEGQHALEVAQAGHEAGLAHGGHVLDVMKTHHDMQMDHMQHGLDVHQAMNPPETEKKNET